MRAIVICTLNVLLAALLNAQATTSVSGSVTDLSGAVVPNATVTLVSDDTSAERGARTDSEGRYSFQQIQPGRYHLLAKAAGFSDAAVNDIRLLVSNPATIRIVFEKVGAVSTTISVSAESVQINTADASLGNAIGDRVITQLPFEARNVVGLLSLQPGVTYLGEPDPANQYDFRSGAVNGGKSDQANVTLDGVDVNDQHARRGTKADVRAFGAGYAPPLL